MLIFDLFCSGFPKTGETHELDAFITMTVDCMVLLKEVPRFSDVNNTSMKMMYKVFLTKQIYFGEYLLFYVVGLKKSNGRKAIRCSK